MSPPRPIELDEKRLRRWPLPQPGDGGKDERGAVLVIAGAPEMPGAAILAAVGALRAGAGKLQVATVRSAAPLVAAEVPEALVMSLPETRRGGVAPAAARTLAPRVEQANAVLIGPGFVDAKASAELARRLVRDEVKFVLDAEALECARIHPDALRGKQVALTPHAKEMAHLLDVTPEEVTRDPAQTALEAAAQFGVLVVLKGATTWIATPDGQLARNQSAGNAGLGTSGSGDTLAGVIVGLAARGCDLFQAAAWGVFLHGRAGDVLARKLGPLGYLARELLAEIPPEMARLSRRPRRA